MILKKIRFSYTLKLAGFALFSCGDTIAKLLTAEFHPFQIAWTRQLGAVVVVVLLLFFKGAELFKSQAPLLQIVRGFCAVVSATCFIFTISYVPLADAVAVTFVAPFFVTILSVFFLGEYVGIRRWVTIVVGFVGTLVIIRPGLGVTERSPRRRMR